MIRMIYGCVKRGGGVHSGSGFSTAHPRTGIVDVIFNVPFADTPAVTATQQYGIRSTGFDDFNAGPGSGLDNLVIVALSPAKVRFKTSDSKGMEADRNFTFIAVGEDGSDDPNPTSVKPE